MNTKNNHQNVSIEIENVQVPKELRGTLSEDFFKIEAEENKIILNLNCKCKKEEPSCSHFLDQKLWIIQSIWEYFQFISFKEANREFGKKTTYLNTLEQEICVESEIPQLKYYWNEHFSKFHTFRFYGVPLHYYYLLLENFSCPRLLLALQYLNEARKSASFSSIKFLNYWLAIEIMLGEKGKENITEALKNKAQVILDDESQKALIELWKTRGKIVHTGKPLEVEPSNLEKIKELSKTLFNKLLLASMADTKDLFFQIKPFS